MNIIHVSFNIIHIETYCSIIHKKDCHSQSVSLLIRNGNPIILSFYNYLFKT